VKLTATGKLRLVKPKGADEEEKKGDPVVAERFRAVRKGLGIQRQVDLAEMIAEAAKANGGRSGTFDQTYISRLETGAIRADTLHIHSAYAAALMLTRDEWADYIEGHLPLEDVRRIRDARLRMKPGVLTTFRRLPNWEELKREALVLDESLRSETFEALADSVVTGPAERVTAHRLAIIAKVTQDIGGDK
jgi:hypothetical protein